jgi:hypothetical protein
MSGGRRGGERRRACATKRMHPTQAREIVACVRETRPSLGPSTRARQSSLRTTAVKRLGGEALASASRLGKPTQVGGTSTGVGVSGRSAARRMFISGASPRAGHVEEKEGGLGLRPCEDQEPRLGCSHVDSLLQKIGRRRLVSNKLGKRAPKRAVRVE